MSSRGLCRGPQRSLGAFYSCVGASRHLHGVHEPVELCRGLMEVWSCLYEAAGVSRCLCESGA